MRLQLLRNVGFEGPKGQIFELLLHPVHAQAMSERDVDIHRLLCDSATRLLFHMDDRPHVMKPVRELDHQDPNVFGHRDEHLSKVLGLLLTRTLELDAGDLRQSLDEKGNAWSKQTLNLVSSGQGVFERVMEQAGNDGVFVDAQVEQNARDFERMDQVGLARESFLTVMDLRRKDVRAL